MKPLSIISFEVMMRLHSSLFFFTLASVLLVLYSCSEEPTPPPPGETKEIALSLVNVLDTRVQLKINVNEKTSPHSIILKRDGQKILATNFFAPDTTITDKGLKPSTTYSYQAFLLRDTTVAQQSTVLQVTTLAPIPPDTSSHEYKFETMLVGDGQSELFDVFAVNDTDVYAVGWIFLNDSTGKLDTNNPYNAVHFNGKKWNLMKIPIRSCPGTITVPFELITLYGFASNDIYFSAGLLTYFNGIQYYTDCSLNGTQLGALIKIWGRSRISMHIVGTKGWIAYYNGSTYQNIITSNTKDLTDIFGNTHDIWTVSGPRNRSDGVVLHKGQGAWEVVDSLSINRKRSLKSVWCDERAYEDEGFLIFAGWGISFRDTTWKEPPLALLEAFPGSGSLFFNDVRGSNRKNVFAAGDFGIVLHYNGASWRRYDELFRYPDSRLQTGIAVTEKSVFIVGIQGNQAVIIRGERK